MQLMIKQRVFSLVDTYDIYDENQNVKYKVKAKFFSVGHKLTVTDAQDRVIAEIKQKLISIMPTFYVEQNGNLLGTIKQKMSMFRPKYELDYKGWKVEGDFMHWNYDVYGPLGQIIHIRKKLIAWGDTYFIDFNNDEDELPGILLVIAIDAANCITHSNTSNN